ncbi:hypothetical protein CGRA01v4_00303 [Colletotrichum graminicola]|nr:hypothetical protein CGRA01v4_00303 [Colletotrichum graminicola]
MTGCVCPPPLEGRQPSTCWLLASRRRRQGIKPGRVWRGFASKACVRNRSYWHG